MTFEETIKEAYEWATDLEDKNRLAFIQSKIQEERERIISTACDWLHEELVIRNGYPLYGARLRIMEFREYMKEHGD